MYIYIYIYIYYMNISRQMCSVFVVETTEDTWGTH